MYPLAVHVVSLGGLQMIGRCSETCAFETILDARPIVLLPYVTSYYVQHGSCIHPTHIRPISATQLTRPAVSNEQIGTKIGRDAQVRRLPSPAP